MNLDAGHKVTILITALQERYQALRTIRERVQSIGVWALGLMAAAGGWLIQAETPLSVSERWVSLAGLIAAVIVLRFVYLADLQKGFNAQQRTTVRLETALGFFDNAVFEVGGGSIYPAAWAEAGKSKGSGRFFASTYGLIYTGAVFLALTLVFA